MMAFYPDLEDLQMRCIPGILIKNSERDNSNTSFSEREKRQAVNNFEVIFDEAETICQVFFPRTHI